MVLGNHLLHLSQEDGHSMQVDEHIVVHPSHKLRARDQPRRNAQPFNNLRDAGSLWRICERTRERLV